MSCSTHQRIPASQWSRQAPTHAAGPSDLPAHRRRRVVRSFGMFSAAGEAAVEALVEATRADLAAGRIGAGEVAGTLAQGLAALSGTYPEAVDPEVAHQAGHAVED